MRVKLIDPIIRIWHEMPSDMPIHKYAQSALKKSSETTKLISRLALARSQLTCQILIANENMYLLRLSHWFHPHIFVSKSSAWVMRTESVERNTKNLIKYQFLYGKLIGTTRTRPIFVRFHYILLFRHWAARYDINYCTCDKATKKNERKTSWNALTPNSVVCFDGYTVSLRMYLFCFPFNPLSCSVIGFLIISACLATAGSIARFIRMTENWFSVSTACSFCNNKI